MQKSVILILSLYEGRNWHPLDRHSTALVAQLNTHILTTDLIPLTRCPKFNTDLSWYSDKQTIRSFKLNRVPIKLKCYSVNDKKERNSLGYVIVPLTPAVEGSKVEAKWYKILGSPSIPRKDPPSLLLSLSLKAMTLDQQKQKSDKFSSSLNGQLYLENPNILSNAVSKNSFAYIGSDKMKDTVSYNNTNGNSDIVQKSFVGSLNRNISKSSNGVCTKDDTVVDLEGDDSLEEEENDIAELDNENEEDLYNFESEEEYSDGDTNSSSDNNDSIQGYSLANDIKNKSTQQVENLSYTVNICHDADFKEKQGKELTNEKESGSDKLPALNDKDLKVSSPNFNHEISKRAAFKESLRLSLKHASLPSPEISIQQSSFSKRMLDTSENLNESETKFKRSKFISVDNSAKSSHNDLSRCFQSHALLDLENNPGATSTALLLSQSLKKLSSPTHFLEQHLSSETENKYEHNNSLQKRLNAHLNEDEGFFQIGNASANDVDYTYSVTIIYAENLNQVVSIDKDSFEPKSFKFRYSLLDWPITTDSFMNLDDPEFMSEKASASIRCSTENLSEYFKQHSLLSIQLVNNEKCLALCTIDMKRLVTITNKEHILLEGLFDIHEVGFSSCLKDMPNHCTAKLGVSIELSLNNSGIFKFHSNNFHDDDICSLKKENLMKIPGKDYDVSKFSDSDSDCNSSICNKRKSRVKSGKRFCSCCSKHYSGNQEEKHYLQKGDVPNYHIMLMNKTKKEVKEWKIERQKCFEKELEIYARSLQEKITNEYQMQLKEMENDLNYRVKDCNLLKEQLSSTMNDFILREKALYSREAKVAMLEKELSEEKAKQLSPADDRISSKIEDKPGICDTKTSQLEFQNCRLQEEYIRAESTIRELTIENIELKRQLIQSENFISTVKEKDCLAVKVETLQERKQYYKEQWMKAISEMHMIHTSKKRFVNLISSGPLPKEQSETELERYGAISLPSHAGYKLKKLKEERKILMESGKYSSDHAIIENIDKKIRKLLLGSS